MLIINHFTYIIRNLEVEIIFSKQIAHFNLPK